MDGSEAGCVYGVVLAAVLGAVIGYLVRWYHANHDEPEAPPPTTPHPQH
jgi:hypothetical protein